MSIKLIPNYDLGHGPDTAASNQFKVPMIQRLDKPIKSKETSFHEAWTFYQQHILKQKLTMQVI